MGLLDRDKQRRARDERRRAREAILNAAGSLFVDHPYEMVQMKAIAGKAGVKQGIPSLLFKDKETLFLEVFLRRLQTWAEPVRERLAGSRGRGLDAAGSVLAQALSEDETFGRFLAVLHNPLERNLEVDSVVDFSERYGEITSELGEALEAACGDELAEGAGKHAITRIFAWAAGVLQVTGSCGSLSYLKVRGLWPAARLEPRRELERLARAALAADPSRED
jgi:AcrR family transcriptional regulator